jgi:hypothetical protein
VPLEADPYNEASGSAAGMDIVSFQARELLMTNPLRSRGELTNRDFNALASCMAQ